MTDATEVKKERFEGREVFTYRTDDKVNPPKPEAVRFYMPRRREWAENNTANLLKFGVKADDLDAIDGDGTSVLPQRVNLIAMNYAIVEYFALPEDKDFVDDLSSGDIDNIIKAIAPEMTGITEEHEKNLPSHSELPNEALNADSAVKSSENLEAVSEPENKSG